MAFRGSAGRVLGDGARTDEYPLWWGWLRSFQSGGLVVGSTTDFVVQGALPYKLHFVVRIDQVSDAQIVETTVTGDLEGPAMLEITPDDGGCRRDSDGDSNRGRRSYVVWRSSAIPY